MVGIAQAVTYPFTTIDMPGFYKLASNVTNEITISASDVTLDMNGGTVSGGANGIVIASGLNNVTIKNGSITSVTTDGIQVGAGCTDIILKDIIVSQALVGINCEQVSNALIRNCDSNQSTTGIQLDMCRNVVLQNCTTNANTHAGFDLLSSTTCSLLECQAIATGDGNSDVDSATVFGFVTANGNGNLFERCIANATLALSVTDSSSLVAGFALRGNEGCTKIINSEGCNTETNVDGFTVPYGILLEGTLDQIETITGLFEQTLSPAPDVQSTNWSPDGKYLLLGGDTLNMANAHLLVAQYDYVAQTVYMVTSISLDSASSAFVSKAVWSPDGNYIAATLYSATSSNNVVYILEFDRTSHTLEIIGSVLPQAATEFPLDITWSPNQQYVAVGFNTSATNIFQVFSVDVTTGRLESIAGELVTTGQVESVDWSPDGKYIVISGNNIPGGTGNTLQVFSFDAATNTLTPKDGIFGPSAFVLSVEWSPNGKYIAVAGEALTEGTGNPLQILSYDRSTDLLSTVTGHFNTDEITTEARWSPDGRYLCVGGVQLPEGIFQILRFDASSPSLTTIDGIVSADEIDTDHMAWTPDGQYISFTSGALVEFTDIVNIVTAIQFPQNNVISGNTVYCNSGGQCPSGVGISAPSITNLVIGNSAFNNPIPRGANEPIVASNYQFVTNVFDQLFGEYPAFTQNIATQALNPQFPVPDVPARIKRTELLLESLIDNLL